MKKTIIYLLAILAITISANAQWVKKSNGLDTTKSIFGFVQLGSNIYNCNYGGVFLSSNNGDNWIAVNSGLTNTSVLSLAGGGNNLYAGTYGGGIFRSTNSGANWIFSGISGNRIWSMYVNGTEVLAGRESGGLARSIDSGATWTSISLGVSFIFSIACSNDNIFTGTRSGVYRSTNNGLNWTNVLSLGLDVGAVAINGSLIFAGTAGGVYISSNNGTNWTASNSGMTHTNISSFAFSGNNVFVATDGGGFYMSSNGGINWQLKNEGSIPPFNIYRLMAANNYIFAGTGEQSVWRRPLSDLIVPIFPLLISPANNSVNQSLNLNLRWSKPQFATKFRVLLAADSLFSNIIVNDSLLTDSVKNVSNLNPMTNYFWKVSAGNSAGWSNYSNFWKFTTVPPVPSAPVLTYPLNNSSGISVTTLLDWDSLTSANTYQAVISTDSLFGSTVWDTTGINTSFINVRPGILANNIKYFWKVRGINQGGTGLYSQVWNFTTSLVNITNFNPEIPVEFKLYNNYPNPFNPVTHIKFDLPKSCNTVFFVYDLTGKEISKINYDNLAAGKYEIHFDASKFSSGVYFYKITAGTFSETKKMLLIK